jgi:hypothetical protein
MAINPRSIEQIELDYETAHGQVAAAFLDPAVNEDTKMLAAAIVQAGSEIALAIVKGSPDRRPQSSS